MRNGRISLFIFLITANLAVVCAFWGTLSGDMVFEPWVSGVPAIALGRLAGLLLQFALLAQLVLIGRITFIERAVGFDRLNRVHRIIGYSLAGLLVAHPLLLSIGYGMLEGRSLPGAFAGLVTGFEEVLSAVGGTLILLGVIALSVPWVRRKLRYESWHALHLATYLALWLAFEHQVESGGDFANRSLYVYWYVLNGSVVALYFLYRFLRPFALWYRHRFVVQRIERESPDTWSVYVGGRNMESFRFEPGQYATLHLFSRGLWAGHPFSFSREYDGRSLRFTIKALGDGTGLIERLTPGTRVLLDGPLGAFTPQRARTGKFLLIAGGIGITPVRALAGALSSAGSDVKVLYGARTKEHTALLDEVAERVPDTHLFLSQDGDIPAGAVRGMIDAQAIRTYVPDVVERDAYVCGPAPMMDAVSDALRQVGVPRRHIHTERFAF